VDIARQLPRAVAETDIGAEVPVEIVRAGKQMTLRLTVGLLNEGDDDPRPASAGPDSGMDDQGGGVLGLTLEPLSDLLRSEYGIDAAVKGVLVTDVNASSEAAQRGVTPGMVIVEVAHQPVETLQEVTERIENLRTLGRSTVLLLLSSSDGEMNYIALPVER